MPCLKPIIVIFAALVTVEANSKSGVTIKRKRRQLSTSKGLASGIMPVASKSGRASTMAGLSGKSGKASQRQGGEAGKTGNEDIVEPFSADCYLLHEQPGAEGVVPRGCEVFHGAAATLRDGSFAREGFQDFFERFLRSGVETFIRDGVPDGFDNSLIDLEQAAERMEQYIFDSSPLVENDFDRLLTLFPEASVDGLRRSLHASGQTAALVSSERNLENTELSNSLVLHDKYRQLQSDDELSAECIDAIVRIVVEVIGLVLSAFGIRSRVLKPFEDYFVDIKGPQLSGLVLEGYRRSRGNVDASFFVGLVASFLSILTWEDIQNALATLGTEDWTSLFVGISLAVVGTLSTGGLALAFLISGLVLQAQSLQADVDALRECFALCSDGFTQSGGQQTTTYVVALDRSSGDITLVYEMYSVPDQLELIYEGDVIFTTGGLVSGSRTVTETIDGEEKSVLVRITAPEESTVWDFSISCPVPDLFE